MGQSHSWEASTFSVSQEISCILWNLKVDYCVTKIPPPLPVLSYMNPFYTLPLYLFTSHCNNCLVAGKILRWPYTSRFSCQKVLWISLLVPLCCICPISLNFLDVIILIIVSKDKKPWSSLWSLSCLLLLPSSCPNTVVSTLFVHTLSLCSFLFQVCLNSKMLVLLFCGEHVKMM